LIAAISSLIQFFVDSLALISDVEVSHGGAIAYWSIKKLKFRKKGSRVPMSKFTYLK
jgi:hypothetical protein